MPVPVHPRFSLKAGILAAAVLCAACGTESPPAFQLTGLDVSRAAVSLETPAVLRGTGIFAAVSLDLNVAEAEMDSSFQVFVGALALDANAATRVDSESLAVIFPVGLPVGLHSVKVVAPSGAEAVLLDALLVAEPALHIEDAGDGSGSEVQSRQLAIGSSLELFAVSRWPDGLYFRPEEVRWSSNGSGATLSPQTSLLVTATEVAAISVVAESGLLGSATAEIQTAACFADAECSDPCRSSNACAAGLCVQGPIDKDSDGDSFIDAACGGDDCADEAGADPGCNGLPGALCHPGLVGADSCDGADNDCDGGLDEDHVAPATSCGLGACAGNVGILSCVAGALLDTCDALAGAAASDATCDNVNDDCDGATDEDYLATATSCGLGACSGNTGTLSCSAGIESDSCDPVAGAAADDASCNNLNDDCDGATDEDYAPVATSCGVGACSGNAGATSCVIGAEIDSCDPLAGAAASDATCDNINDDCDGATDEDFGGASTSCGVGACTGNAGTLSCVVGVETDDCDPVAGAAADDASCNNVNDDCDAATDEDYQVSATSCGIGACAGNVGTLTCIIGVEIDDCDPLFGATGEVAGDQVDQDCDGQELCFEDGDEDSFGSTTTLVSTDVDCIDPGESTLSSDCDDGNSAVNPGAVELVDNGVDNDCDGSELCFLDGDDDGFRPDAVSTVVSLNLVCTDAGEAQSSDPTSDCDDGVSSCTTDCTNADGDSLAACAGDCDDSLATGNSCTASCSSFFQDADGDGFGLASSSVSTCVAPAGFVADDQDCADLTPVDPICGGLDGNFCNPAVAEGPLGDASCSDGADNDCDGLVDLADDSCIASVPATCEDALQNGDESGVDCGGSICAPCSAATQIYRSVGPGKTDPLMKGSFNPFSIAGGVATFASDLPDTVGVGDVLEYDSDGNLSLDALAFIHRRITASSYQVRNAAGATAQSTAAPTTLWGAFRAYTSLDGLHRGDENLGIEALLRDFDSHSGGRDIVASNEVWNVACYADAPDTVAVEIKDWVTSANNLLRIFVPSQASQVGVTQRHAGVWDESKYLLDIVLEGGTNYALLINEDFVRIQGLQIRGTIGGNGDALVGLGESGGSVGPVNDVRISHSLIRGAFTGTKSDNFGILAENDISWSLWNSVVFDIAALTSSLCLQQTSTSGSFFAGNNTFANCPAGVRVAAGTSTFKNNIAPRYSGSFDTSSNNNIAGDTSSTGGAADQSSATMDFVAAAAGDFHLNPSFAAAIGQGLDLSGDPDLSFIDDMDSELRTVPWTIGADQ